MSKAPIHTRPAQRWTTRRPRCWPRRCAAWRWQRQERTRRNEYGGVYNGLYRQFGIASYRRMPPARLREALEWLERWRGDLMGEPEPPPDIE